MVGATAASVMALVQLVPGALLAPHLGGLSDRRRAGRVPLGGYGRLPGLWHRRGRSSWGERPACRCSRWRRSSIWRSACRARRRLRSCRRSWSLPEELAAANAGQGWLESAATLVVPIRVALLLTRAAPPPQSAAWSCLPCLHAACCDDRRAAAVRELDRRLRSRGATGGLRLLAESPAVVTLVAVLGAQYILAGALDLIYVVLALVCLGWAGAARGT